jgi:predicted DNA-binding transcriptional regulator YafY
MDERDDAVVIDYTNWRGERSERTVRPIRFYFGSSQWHPRMQWLMEAFDTSKSTNLVFALGGIHSWRPPVGGG